VPRTDRVRTTSRAVALIAFVALIAASCGVSRDSALETTVTTNAAAPSTAPEATTPPEPPSLPEPLGLDPKGDAAIITFADGTEAVVSNAQLIQADADFRGSATFVNLVLQSGGVGIPIENVLIDQVILQATLDKMLAERDAAVSEASVAQARDEVAQSLAPLLGPDGDGVKLLDELGAYGDLVSGLQGQLISLSATLDPPQLACVRHILLETEAEAQTAIDDIAAGADFSDVAIERSTGPSGPAGGDLGCASTANYVPEFAAAVDAAEAGTVLGPVQTEFGFHVIIVDSFEEDTASQGQLVGAQRLAEEELRTATVTINPQLGSWDPVSLAVTPA
jgi:hypothetical protein